MTTTPMRRLVVGATSALLAAGLLAPAAIAAADELPVEHPTTTVLDEAAAAPDPAPTADDDARAAAPADAASEPDDTPAETPAAEAQPADEVAATPAEEPAPTQQAADGFTAAAASASLLDSVVLAPGEVRTITAPVADAQRYSFFALGDDIAGNIRTVGGQNYALAAYGGYSANNVVPTSHETGEVTLSLQNNGTTARAVPYAFAFVRVGSPLTIFASGMGNSDLSIDANPGRAGLTGQARMIALDGTSTTLPMAPIVPGSVSYRATFGSLPAGRYLFEVSFEIDGVTHQRVITAHAAAPETTPPYVEYTTEPAASNASGWFRRAVTASLAASDTGSGVWRLFVGLNATPAAIYSPRANVTIPTEGVHTLNFYAEDYQNNVSAMVSRTIRIDLTAPVVNLDGLADGQRIEQDAEARVTYDCADPLSGIVECRGTVETGELLDTATLGTHTFSIIAADRAGNETRIMRSYTVFAPDTTAPRLDVAMPVTPASGWHVGPVTVPFTASDDLSAIALVGWEYRNGSDVVTGSTAEPEGELEFTATGTYELTMWAEDAAGNRSSAQDFVIRLDLDRPEIEVLSPLAEQLPGGRVAQHARVLVDFACADIGSGVDRCDATTPVGGLLPTGTPGAHQLRIVAVDAAGNRSERVVSYTVDAAPAASRDPRLAQTGAELVLPGIVLVAVLLAAGAMLLAARRLGGR